METKDMLYIVTEYAKNGEMFGEFSPVKSNVGWICWSQPIAHHNISGSYMDLN